jgi:putative membrane protein
MKHMLFKFVTAIAALMVLANLMPGVAVSNWSTAFVAVAVMGLVNTFLRPVLNLLTFPINFFTFGLFAFVLNAAMFGLSAYLVPGFEVKGFINAIIGSSLYGFISTILLWILEWVAAPDKKSPAQLNGNNTQVV